MGIIVNSINNPSNQYKFKQLNDYQMNDEDYQYL